MTSSLIIPLAAIQQSDVASVGDKATTLGVRGLAAVKTAVLNGWRSFYSANALAARTAQGALVENEGMALLIQPLLTAECAGVAFSVDPVHERRDRLVINAAWGLGAGVVDGTVANDTIWVRRADLAVEQQQIGEKRQAEHQAWQMFETPPILGLPAADLPARPEWRDEVSATNPHAAMDRPDHLTGLGVSHGRRRGCARIVTDAFVLPELKPGDILVAKNIGPTLTPLFPILGGLVLEQGSVGQHAAATAREYGVPAAIQVKDATKLIADDSWITVDGEQGTVGYG